MKASAASAAGNVAAIVVATTTVPRSGGVPPPFFWLPELPARGVESDDFATGGNAGPPAQGAGETAADLTARLPALAFARISKFALSSGVIEGDGARATAGAVWWPFLPTGDLVFGRVRFAVA